jgi:hypothetical protein
MKKTKAKPNLFVVDTPHQMLNAVEAVHSFHLSNNHLLVTRPKSGTNDRLAPLIKAEDWETVSYSSVWIPPKYSVQKSLGLMTNRWYCRCLHLLEMHAMAKVVKRFPEVDKLFLGHYCPRWTPFMRHIANTIKYDALYLMDDGTDTIEVNNRRLSVTGNEPEVPIKEISSDPSTWSKLESHLREKYGKWNLAEAPHATFFTTYDLDIRKGDQLIKNNYSHLRSLTPVQRVYLPDTVVFLGLCSADDYFEIDTHLDFLSQIRDYFAGKKIMYAAHPRDTASRVTRIRDSLDCQLWPSSSVIEHDLIVKGIKPKVVAAFVSSALITLAELMDPDVEIVCFHIAPEHWHHWREDAVGAYSYIKTKLKHRVTVVPLHPRQGMLAKSGSQDAVAPLRMNEN